MPSTVPETLVVVPDASLDPVETGWAKAKRYVESATLFQRASLAAQIMAGLSLAELHRQWDVKRGRPEKITHDASISRQPWAKEVEARLGISHDTARRWMEMARAARKRLKDGGARMGEILAKHPGALTPAEQELLSKAVHKISDGRTQLEFLLECGVTKAPQGSGARGGNTHGAPGSVPAPVVETVDILAEGQRAATRLLIDSLTEHLTHPKFPAADRETRKHLHGLLVDLAAAVGNSLKEGA